MNIQPVNYQSESVRPLTSLVFITPMLLAYEAGIFYFGQQAMRNAHGFCELPGLPSRPPGRH